MLTPTRTDGIGFGALQFLFVLPDGQLGGLLGLHVV
jgi:hypothetical protein